jgi:hypothetical protein
VAQLAPDLAACIDTARARTLDREKLMPMGMTLRAMSEE